MEIENFVTLDYTFCNLSMNKKERKCVRIGNFIFKGIFFVIFVVDLYLSLIYICRKFIFVVNLFRVCLTRSDICCKGKNENQDFCLNVWN